MANSVSSGRWSEVRYLCKDKVHILLIFIQKTYPFLIGLNLSVNYPTTQWTNLEDILHARSGPIIENALIEWRWWSINLKIGKNDVTDSYEGVYCNYSFWICGPKPTVWPFKQSLFRRSLGGQGNYSFAVFSRVKIGIFLIFRILVDLLRVERPWLWLWQSKEDNTLTMTNLSIKLLSHS